MKKVVISFLIIGVITSLGIIGSKYFNKDKKLDSDKTLISYYVETGEGTGVYEKQDGTTWPEGYVLNEEKSTCDNGSTLSWDSSTNSVVVTANKEDSCKVYLNVDPIIRIVSYDGHATDCFGTEVSNIVYSKNFTPVEYNCTLNGVEYDTTYYSSNSFLCGENRINKDDTTTICFYAIDQNNVKTEDFCVSFPGRGSAGSRQCIGWGVDF